MIHSKKSLDALAVIAHPEVRQFTFEGTTRSSKTVTAIEAFFWRAYWSAENLFAVASFDMDTLRDNILEANGFGILQRFRGYCSGLKKEKIGGYFFEIDCGTRGRKKVRLCPYGNKAKWKKVLGGTIGGFLIDEANLADRTFILECYARQTSCDHPFIIYTLNGDVPTASIYEEINPSRILGECPASTRAEMLKCAPMPGRYYMHFTMRDNPAMTDEKISAAYSIYPPGSFYYKTKILGERGVQGRATYIDYIDEAGLLKKLDVEKFHSFTVSMDVGATRARNSITLIGYSYDYRTAAVLDKETFAQCGYSEKTERLMQAIRRWKGLGAKNIECTVIDSAEQNYIADLRSTFAALGLPPVIGSYKATIKERIDLVCLLMSQGKLLFNDTEEGRAALSAFKEATWEEGKFGEVRKDENEPWNDILDSIEYGLTRHMKKLLTSAKEVLYGTDPRP